MEALGLVSSIIAVMTVAGAIIDNIKVIRVFSRSLVDAPEDVEQHLKYLETLRPSLDALDADCHKDGTISAADRNLWNVVMGQLQKNLEETQMNLAKLEKKLQGHRLSPGQVAARIREAFSADDTRARRQDISSSLADLHWILQRAEA